MPSAYPQIATVLSNDDPDQKGRIQVQFQWQIPEGLKTNWIRVMTPDAGKSDLHPKNRGHVFIPEEGDQVMVGFRYGDPSRPFVMGSMFHGMNGAGGDSKNVIKSMITRSGHELVFDDTDNQEKITLTDKKGNLLIIDTAGDNIDITAGNNITLRATNIKLYASKEVNIEAGTTISIDAEDKSVTIDNSTFLKTKYLDQIVEKDMTVKAENIDQTADKNIRTTAKKDILVSAKQKFDQRGGKMDISTVKGNLRLNGKTKTEVKGKQVKIN